MLEGRDDKQCHSGRERSLCICGSGDFGRFRMSDVGHGHVLPQEKLPLHRPVYKCGVNKKFTRGLNFLQKLLTFSGNQQGPVMSSGSEISANTRNYVPVYNETSKRIIDVILSISLLIFTAPLMAVVALTIKCDSVGPVLYRQKRVGKNGQHFTLLKFRSMVQDAEREGLPIWASERDPRVTRVGRIIRFTRIDELPQLCNVLGGEMSMIGPRPERPYFVDHLSEIIPSYALRHSAKPGITGWAQINYPYGASVEDAREKLSYDLYYINNFSLMLELRIIILTVRVVMLGQGAR
jgi:exopolysaccharide biosynthesis polyprenyl glycosylphosphotransferase